MKKGMKNHELNSNYFSIIGLNENTFKSEICTLSTENLEENLTKFSCCKIDEDLPVPISDINLIFPDFDELCPVGFKCITRTISGLDANFNCGSFFNPACYLCYKRSLDKPPIIHIDLIEITKNSKLSVPSGYELLKFTFSKRIASIDGSQSGYGLFLIYRRSFCMAHQISSRFIVDLAVIMPSKNERPLHGYSVIQKTVNSSLVGSDTFICYFLSKGRHRYIGFDAEMISKYPEHSSSYEIPQELRLFCAPNGIQVKFWFKNSSIPLPESNQFILTNESGQKIYGSCLTFFEEIEDKTICELLKLLAVKWMNMINNQGIIPFVNKTICILSIHPLHFDFLKFLRFLYSISISGNQSTSIERHVVFFMRNVPKPTEDHPTVYFEILSKKFSISLSPLNLILPLSGANYVLLIYQFKTQDILALLFCLLTEQKIVLHSFHTNLLTPLAEALINMIFPFSWQCPYIPFYPIKSTEILNSPTPYLFGVHSQIIEKETISNDIFYLDCDNFRLKISTEYFDPKRPLYKFLHEKGVTKLFYSIEDIKYLLQERIISYSTSLESYEEILDLLQEQSDLEETIREAFLRFNCHVMYGYRDFFLPMTHRPTKKTSSLGSIFDVEGFIRLKSNTSNHDRFFYEKLTKTQLFSNFIEIRSGSSIVNESFFKSIHLFDECLSKFDSNELFFANKSSSINSLYIIPPNYPLSNDEKPFIYNRFPKLDINLMYEEEQFYSNKLTDSMNNNLDQELIDISIRTKEERLLCINLAMKQTKSQTLWAKLMYENCYICWFILLISYCSYKINNNSSVIFLLEYSIQLLKNCSEQRIMIYDEISFRILIKMASLYNCPLIVLKIFKLLRQNNMKISALTYRMYSRALQDAKWSKLNDQNKRSNLLQKWVTMIYLIIASNKMMSFRNYSTVSTYKSNILINESKDDLTNSCSDTSSNNQSISLGSCSNIFDNSEHLNDDFNINSKEIFISSFQQCPLCELILFDEEIMSGWSPNDSDWKTTCTYCRKEFIPNLYIIIRELTTENNEKFSNLNEEDTPSKNINGKSFSVPYLNMLVLRKELENSLYNSGHAMFLSKDFISNKSILYWNLLWNFHRLKLKSFLSNLLLPTEDINNGVSMKIYTCWDTQPFFPSDPLRPTYIILNFHERNKHENNILNRLSVINGHFDLMNDLLILNTFRNGQKSKSYLPKWNIYRELLLICFFYLKDFDIEDFDKKFRRFLRISRKKNVPSNDEISLDLMDLMPSSSAIVFRRTFRNDKLYFPSIRRKK